MPELHGNIGLNTVKAVALESAVTCSRLSLESLASTRRSRYFQAGGTWLSGRHSLDAFGPSCRCEDAARVCAATACLNYEVRFSRTSNEHTDEIYNTQPSCQAQIDVNLQSINLSSVCRRETAAIAPSWPDFASAD
jgi:hypothetical protein